MQSSLRRRSRTVQLLARAAVMLLIFGGCSTVRDIVVVKKPPPRVSVKGYPLDLVYGAEPQAAAEAAELLLEALAPEFAEDFFFPVFSPTGPSFAPSACPEPGGDVIVEPIALDVSKALAPGVYRMKQEGTLTIAGILTVPLTGFSNRTIRNLTYGDAGSFSYEVESVVSLRRVIQRFTVRPADGVFLTYQETVSQGRARRFSPVLPVEVFPLPATVNSAISSAGLDALTGEVLTISGRITKKERYEGCNEAYDAWQAETTWVFARPDNATQPPNYDYDYAIAPQLGGLMVWEHFAGTEVLRSDNPQSPPLTISTDVTSTVASATPSPDPNA